MNSQQAFERAEKITNAVLYEDHALSPDRPQMLKNQPRLTSSGLYPQMYRGVRESIESCYTQTECLVIGNSQTTLDLKMRFLHLTQRAAVPT